MTATSGATDENSGDKPAGHRPGPDRERPAIGYRNIVGIGLVGLLVLASPIVLIARISDPESIDCEETEQEEIKRSRGVLNVELRRQIRAELARLEDMLADLDTSSRQLERVQSEIDGIQAKIGSQQTAIDEQAAIAADESDPEDDAAPDGTTLDVLQDQLAALEDERLELDTKKAVLGSQIEELELSAKPLPAQIAARLESLRSNRSDAENTDNDGEDLVDLVNQEDQEHREYEEKLTELQNQLAGRDVIASRAVTGRSRVNLRVQLPVEPVHLGSQRKPKRTETVLATVSSTATDASGESAESGGSGTENIILPQKARYLTWAGQISRSDGQEIAADSVHVWANRISASTLLLSICVDPDANLHAGRYVGDIRLVDPALEDLDMRIEVTAQSRFINWLYLLLVIVPLMAFMYIWITARLSADKTPWKWNPLKSWAGENFVLLFAVGFAAVWATLQVAFNDTTWGSSLVGAAAVVGGSLVAAVTAMTAVAGKVRGPSIVESKNSAAQKQPSE